MLTVVESTTGRKGTGKLFELDKVARAGALRRLMATPETEVADYVVRQSGIKTTAEGPRALVPRQRKLTFGVGVGTLELRAPRVTRSPA
jgi:hypothetical protein